MRNPLCCQTVTIYRKTGDTVSRTVAEDCFYQWEDCLEEADEGVRFRRKFLLIAPVEAAPGDRVLAGVGPVVTADEWAQFLPVHIPTLAEASYASPKYFCGRLHHYEAGRK